MRNPRERISEFTFSALFVVGAILFAVWSRSLLSIIFAASAAALILFSLKRSLPLGEEEMMRRHDRAMGTSKDDPSEMARGVP